MRENRLRRNLPLEIDLAAVLTVPEAARATEEQLMMAYSRALKRTGVTLRKQALMLIKAGIAPKRINDIRRRIQSFSWSRGQDDLSELRVWFGLNAIKVKDLKGRLSATRLPQRRDPQTGRFLEMKTAASRRATFRSSGNLGEQTWEHGFISRGKDNRGKRVRTISVFDPATGRSREAEVDIYEPMLNAIEDDIFPAAAAIFFHHFTADLRGRLKARVHVDPRPRRRIR